MLVSLCYPSQGRELLSERDILKNQLSMAKRAQSQRVPEEQNHFQHAVILSPCVHGSVEECLDNL